MSRNASFRRKVLYIIAIAVLLLPLYVLSQPATVDSKGVASAGGKLAQLRTEYRLSQADLGAIDPASETMKLATLGMRGPAVNVLWHYANHYKKYEDWDNLEATVQQIIRLQPNFLNVWDFQAHNLSYNVSVEFDDYRFRYQWVKKGIDFLMLGTEYNQDEPGLLYSLGWFTGQKIGRADESVQFRRLFREDKDFHAEFRKHGVDPNTKEAQGPDFRPDNWLVARLWHLEGEAAHARSRDTRPLRTKGPLLFYSGAPMAQINGSAAMQKDGFFFQRAQIAWEDASKEWREYGEQPIPVSGGFDIKLNNLEALRKQVEDLNAEIDKLAPGIRERIREEKLSKLSDEDRALIGTVENAKTVDIYNAAVAAEAKIVVTIEEIANEADQDVRKRIRELADQIKRTLIVSQSTASNRNIVNFEYWRTRCESEKTDLAQGARADLHRAEQLRKSGEQFEEARAKYASSFAAWAKVFEKYPALEENADASDIAEGIDHYNDLLGQLEVPFPSDFPLMKFMEKHETGRKVLEQVRLLSPTTDATTAPASDPAPAANSPEPAPADASDKPAESPPAEGTNTPSPAAGGEPAAEKSAKGAESPPASAPATVDATSDTKAAASAGEK